VAQEVFISFHRLHSASAQFAPAWLHRAAAHTALNRVRAASDASAASWRKRQTKPRGRPIRSGMLEASEDRRIVRAALARLAPKPAAVLVLRASGLSYAESPQAIGVGTGTDRNIVEARRGRTAQGGHSWHIYLKELCAGWLTIRMR